jgi:hypothetical protein
MVGVDGCEGEGSAVDRSAHVPFESRTNFRGAVPRQTRFIKSGQRKETGWVDRNVNKSYPGSFGRDASSERCNDACVTSQQRENVSRSRQLVLKA